MRLLAKYPLSFVAFVLLFFLVVAYLSPPVGRLAERVNSVLAAMGIMLLALNEIYAKSERFFLWVNQARFRITRETIQWNFTVDVSSFEHARPLEAALDSIKGLGISGTVVWLDNPDHKIVNMPGYTLRIFMTPPAPDIPETISSEEHLTLQLSGLELPFSRYKAKIDGEVFPLIESVVENVRPHDKKFCVKIGFQSPNPYFGFFVRRLDVPKILAFQCDLFEPVAGRNEVVRIDKDSITIVTASLQAARTLSSKYVALSVPSE